jgi:hypothetical protein
MVNALPPSLSEPHIARASRSGWKEINFALTADCHRLALYRASISSSTSTSLVNSAHPADWIVVPVLVSLDFCPCNRQRGNRSGLGTEDGLAQRSGDPLRLLEASAHPQSSRLQDRLRSEMGSAASTARTIHTLPKDSLCAFVRYVHWFPDIRLEFAVQAVFARNLGLSILNCLFTHGLGN